MGMQLTFLIILLSSLLFSSPVWAETRTQVNTDSKQELTNKNINGVHNLKFYGAVGDGVADDGAVFLTLMDQLAAANPSGFAEVIFPSGRYRFASCIPSGRIPNYVVFRGLGQATISKECNGDLFSLGSGGALTKWLDLQVDANGQTYTGAVWRLGSNTNGQEFAGLHVFNGADSVFTLEDIGGCQMTLHDSVFVLHETTRTNGAVIKNTNTLVESQACPRHWHHNWGLAFTWFYKGTGLSTFYADHIYSSGFSFTGGTSLGSTINNVRMAVPAGQTAVMRGNSIIVTNSEIGGDIEIGSDFANGLFVNNILDPSKTFTDNSPTTSRVDNPKAPYKGNDRLFIDGFYYDNFPATSGGTLLRFGGDSNHTPTAWIAPRAGSIIGVSVKSNEARSGGVMNITVYKNGSPMNLSAALNGSNTTFHEATQAQSVDTFVAGDVIELHISTLDWSPTTADVRATLEVRL
jgi:hypothetical protein